MWTYAKLRHGVFYVGLLRLARLPITSLDLEFCNVANLEPLRGMPIAILSLGGSEYPIDAGKSFS